MTTTQSTPDDNRDLAERIFDHEATASPFAHATPTAILVSEKLRRALIRLVGIAGFASVLARALALGRAKLPELHGVAIAPDGSLEGFNTIAEQDQTKAGVLLITELLSLLGAFVGQSFVLRLVLDTWPDLPGSDHSILEKN